MLLCAVFWTAPAFAAEDESILDPIEVTSGNDAPDFLGWSPWSKPRAGQTKVESEVSQINAGAALQRDTSVQFRDAGSATLSIRGSQQADRVSQFLEFVPLNDGDGLGVPPVFYARDFWSAPEFLKGPSDAITGRASFAGSARYRFLEYKRPTLGIRGNDSNGKLDNRAITLAVPLGNGFVGLSHETKIEGHREFNDSETQHAVIHQKTERVQALVLYAQSRGNTPGPIDMPYRSTFDSKGVIGGAAYNAPIETTSGGKLNGQLVFTGAQLNQEFDRDTAFASRSNTARARIAGALDFARETWSSRIGAETEHSTLDATYSGTKQHFETPASLNARVIRSFGSSWDLMLAGRYETQIGMVLPAVDLRYAANSELSFFTRYSQGSRRPSLSDRYASVSYFRGNDALKPEQSQSFEIGSRYILPLGATQYDQAEFTLSAFQTRFTDLFDTRVLSPNVQTKVNSGSARLSGLELGANLSYFVWEVLTSATFLDAREEESRLPLRLAPKSQFSSALAHRIGPFRFELRATHWSEFYDRNVVTGTLERLTPFTVWDFTVTSIALSRFDVTFLISNLTDQARQLTLGYPEPGRRFHLGLKTRF